MLERSGADEALVVAALAAAGVLVAVVHAVVNDSGVRDFPRALGNAAVLAVCVRLTPRALVATRDLEALLAQRCQPLQMLTAQRQRLALAQHHDDLAAHVA